MLCANICLSASLSFLKAVFEGEGFTVGRAKDCPILSDLTNLPSLMSFLKILQNKSSK